MRRTVWLFTAAILMEAMAGMVRTASAQVTRNEICGRV